MGAIGSELVTTITIDGYSYDIYGCYDGDTPENEFDFYDVYTADDGMCQNEGDPFYEKPSESDIKEIHDRLVEEKYFCAGCDRADHSNYDKCGGCPIAG